MEIRCEHCGSIFRVENSFPIGKALICGVCNHRWLFNQSNVYKNSIVSSNTNFRHKNDSFLLLLDLLQSKFSKLNQQLHDSDIIAALKTMNIFKSMIDLEQSSSKKHSSIQYRFLNQLSTLTDQIIDVLTQKTHKNKDKSIDYSNNLSKLGELLNDQPKDQQVTQEPQTQQQGIQNQPPQTESKVEDSVPEPKVEDSVTELKVEDSVQENENALVQLIHTLENALKSLKIYPDNDLIKAWNYLSQAEGMINLSIKTKIFSPNLKAELILLQREIHKTIKLMESGSFSELETCRILLKQRIHNLQKYVEKDLISLIKNNPKNKVLNNKIKPLDSVISEKPNVSSFNDLSSKSHLPIQAINNNDEDTYENEKIRPLINALKLKNAKNASSLMKDIENKHDSLTMDKAVTMHAEKKQPISNVETHNSTGIALRKENSIDPSNRKQNLETLYIRNTKEEDDLSSNPDESVPSFIKRSKGLESSTKFVNKRGDSGKSYFPTYNYDEDSTSLENKTQLTPQNKEIFNKPSYYRYKHKERSNSGFWYILLAVVFVILLAVLIFVGYRFFSTPTMHHYKSTIKTTQTANSLPSSSNEKPSFLKNAFIISHQNAKFIKSPLGNTLLVQGNITNNTNQIIKSVILRVKFVNQNNILIASWTTSVIQTIPPSKTIKFSSKHVGIPNVNGYVKVQVENAS